MTPENQLKQIAIEIGADLKKPEYNPYDQSYEVDLWAPDGNQWNANGCAFMGGTYWSYIKGSKNECYQDLIERAKMGLGELDHEL